MRSRVYVTVRCPSVYLSQHGPTAADPLLQVCCSCGPGRQEISIDCGMAGDQLLCAAGECGQCLVVSVRRKLNADLVSVLDYCDVHWE